MSSSRSTIASEIIAKIITGGRATTAVNTRSILNDLNASFLNINDDANANGGYMAIDNTGKVDITKIKSGSPVNNFLRDDGSWQTVVTSLPSLNGVLTVGNTTSGEDMTISVGDDFNLAGNFYMGDGTSSIMYLYNSQSGSQLEIKNKTVGYNAVEIILGTSGSLSELHTNGPAWAMNQSLRFDTLALTNIYVNNGGNGIRISGRNDVTGNYGITIKDDGKLLSIPTYNYTTNTDPVFGVVGVNSSGEFFNTGLSLGSYLALAGGAMTGNILFSGSKGIDTTATVGTDTLNIGATNADVINYGNSGTTHNFLGTAIYELQVNSYVTDKLMTLNYGGAVSSGIGVGFEIQENSAITGYFKTNAARSGFSILAPANTSYTDFVLTASVARTKTFQDTTSTIAEYGNNLSVFAATTSAQLAGVISDETGTGALVFANSPVLAGNPTAPTQSQGDNSTKLSTTAYVDTALDTANQEQDLAVQCYMIYLTNR